MLGRGNLGGINTKRPLRGGETLAGGSSVLEEPNTQLLFEQRANV